MDPLPAPPRPTSTTPDHDPSQAPVVPPGWSSPPPADLGNDGSPSAWLLVWTIVVVKLITLVVTVAVAQSWDAGAIVALTSWIWVVVVAVLIAGPLLFRLRLRRVRARRAQLLRAEWLLDEAEDRT
jgi:hypothetical protein